MQNTIASTLLRKKNLLILNRISLKHQARIYTAYNVTYAPTNSERDVAIGMHGEIFDAVLTTGSVGLTAQEISQLTNLKIVCALGAGFDKIDINAAKKNGITVTHGPNTNADCVADHAIGLLIAIVRNLRMLDIQCRAGLWNDALPSPMNFSGKKMGIVGLGIIGKKIAERAAAFNTQIGYHNRNRINSCKYIYFSNLVDMCKWCDYLMVATPGGPDTKDIIGERELSSLGSDGYIVNISRGTTINTASLADSLRLKKIAGAAIDVYESEPQTPSTLIGFDNIIISPHMAGWSQDATQASVDLFLKNIGNFFEGSEVLHIIS